MLHLLTKFMTMSGSFSGRTWLLPTALKEPEAGFNVKRAQNKYLVNIDEDNFLKSNIFVSKILFMGLM